MGKLVAVIGNTGVGKTTLVEAICRQGDFVCATEENESRPYNELFSQNLKKYALVNQVDFLLFRAEQEIKIRKHNLAGIQDGGLEQDFHIFTKLFFENGHLSKDEFLICQRLYELIREFLPPPDLIVWLKAAPEVIADRFQERNRRLSIAQIKDIAAIDEFLHAWLDDLSPEKLVIIDSETEAGDYASSVEMVSRLLES